jgi:hypothetical protein
MLPVVPAFAAPEMALDGTAVSQELRDLVAVLQAADDALKAAEAAFDGKHLAYRRFEKKNPQPSNGHDRRAWRRWDGKFKRGERENGYFAAQSAQRAAWRAFDNARRAIAEYRARDMNEMVHMACLAYVFEGKRRCSDHILSAGVALDVALLGTAGRIAA